MHSRSSGEGDHEAGERDARLFLCSHPGMLA
jgi:hypothetical protein